jgi:uncharacterized membrane protein YoaK (UPF0700 family)
MSSGSQQHERAYQSAGHAITTRNILLILLACAAGAIDAISYAGLGRVFTANMTGNTVLLGLALANLDPDAIMRAGAALIGFMIGAAISARIVGQRAVQAVWSAQVTKALAVESAMLIGVLVGWHIIGDPTREVFWRLALIDCTAIAMGMQSTAIHELSISGVSTTYITGTIARMVERALVRPPNPLHAQTDPAHTGGELLLLALWLVYISGAVGAALLLVRIHMWAMLAPIALVVITVAIALASYGSRDGTADAAWRYMKGNQ